MKESCKTFRIKMKTLCTSMETLVNSFPKVTEPQSYGTILPTSLSKLFYQLEAVRLRDLLRL
jgi:hypothetical protein